MQGGHRRHHDGVSSKPAIRPGSWLSQRVVGAVLTVVRALSVGARRRLAAGVGALAWALGIRKMVALENLAMALPELEAPRRLAIARAAYDNLAQAALEAVTSDLVPDAQLEQMVQVPDWCGIDVLFAQGKPMLVASAHFGSWELFAEVMSRRKLPMSAVVRPLAGAFNAWVVANRRSAGLELILQRGALRQMLIHLRRGRAVVQLIDQVLPAKDGVFVPFFGRLASTTPALSMAALRTGVPVFLVLAERQGEGLVMHVEGPIPVPPGATPRERCQAHVAELTRRLEARIRQSPEQWLWLHRRWKVKPPSPGTA